MNDYLLTNGGENPSKTIYFPDEQLPPPHPEPTLEPPRNFVEAIDDLGDAFINLATAITTAFEPLFKVMQEYEPVIRATLEQANEDKRYRAKQDLENKRRMQRGGKWKAF